MAIPLTSASNLRDLGGWPTDDGRTVRRGLIYRAPALIELSASDQATIATLGLRTICDLRGVREADANPVLIGARRVALPIEPSVGGSLRDILRTGHATGQMTPDDMMDLLRDAYRAYALQAHDRYRTVFDLLAADPPATPLLLHCSAGKDRTGFGVAMILTALGVAWDHVMADYLATNTEWKREIAGHFDLPPELKDVLLSAHADLLTAAFDAIRDTYGSTDVYLAQTMGLTPPARAQLRDRLTQ